MRLLLEVLFVIGLAAMAVVGLAVLLVVPARPWRLNEEQRSGSWMHLAAKWSVAGTGIWLWRFKLLGTRVLLAGLAIATLTGATMLLIWGE